MYKYFSYLLLISLLTACANLSSLQPLAPKVALSDIKVAGIGLMEQNFLIRLEIDNPNSFPIPIVGMDYDVLINGKPFFQGKNDTQLTIPAQGKEFLDIDVISSSSNILEQIQSWQTLGSDLSYQLKGNVKLTDFAIAYPFERQGSVPFTW